MKKIIRLDSASRVFIVITGIFCLGIILKELQSILLPFVIAYFFFFAFTPMNENLHKYKVPKFLATLLNIFVLLLISYLVSSFFIDSLMKFTGNSDYYIKKLDKIIIGIAKDMKVSGSDLKNFSIQTLISKIDYGSLAGGIISPTFSLLGSVLLMIFFLIFITSGHSSVYKAIERTYLERFSTLSLKKMQRQMGKIQNGDALSENEAQEIESIKKSALDKLHKTFQSIPEQIQKYLLTKVLLNAGAGLTIGIMLAVLGIDFAQIWGFSIFFLNFIPTIGSAIALALPVLMTLIQTESVSFALLILGLIAGLQTVFFNVLEPMILGKRLNLNPIIILLSVLIWGYLWGIVGMLLAVPITAVIKIVISNFNSPNMKFISDLMDDQ